MTKRSQQDMASPAPHKRREICLDLDVQPVPRGWERCLDLKSGVMYFKQMETATQLRTDSKKKLYSVVSDRFKTSRDDTNTTKLDLERDLKLRANCDQQKHSMPSPIDKGSSPAQNLKRQKLLPNDEDDGLGLQLSLSLRSDSYTNNQAVKSRQNLQSEEKIPQHLKLDLCQRSLDLFQKSSLQERRSQVDSSARVGQNPVHDTASSSFSRCSSSASSLSEAAEAGKETGKNTQEAESTKNKSAGLGQLAEDKSSNSIADMMAAGCAKCLMFVLLFRKNPKCPKCGSSILLDLPGPNEKFIGRRNLER